MGMPEATKFNEIMRTPAHKGGDKAPEWKTEDASKQIDSVPEKLEIQIWDKNRFHKDVFCGSKEIACSRTMNDINQEEFTIQKDGKSTGKVKLTIIVTRDNCGMESDVVQAQSDLQKSVDHYATFPHIASL